VALLLLLLGLSFLPLFHVSPSTGKPEALTLLENGEVLLAKHDYSAAVTALTEASNLEPLNPRTYYLLGKAQKNLGADDKALADLSEAIRLDPKDSEALELRGIIYDDKDQPDMAIADYSAAIRSMPLAITYVFRGIARRKRGDFDGAINDFTEAIRIDPDDVAVDAYCSRAHLYRIVGDFNKAISDYTQALRLRPDSAEAYAGREAAYRKTGDTANADADLAQLARIRGGKRAPRNSTRVTSQ
jgi:tetratricopeptide (TPR) repeat protein